MTSVDSNRADRARRAEVLAGAAADALLLVHDGPAVSGRIVLDEHDSAGRAVAGAVAAFHAFLDHAEFRIHAGRAHMVLRLLFLGDLPDGAGRAKFGAAGALRAAVAALVGHLGLHEVLEVRGGTEHVVRALGDTQLAGRATAVEVLDALGSGGRHRDVTLGHFLVQDGGEAAVHLLLLRLQCGRSHGQRGAGDERPAARVALFRCPIRSGMTVRVIAGLTGNLLLPPGELILQPTELAGVDAVEAVHAAGVVDLAVLYVDAGGLAVVLALLAALAHVRVDHRAEHREAGEETQCRAHGADGVAIRATVPPGQDDHHDERDRSHDEGGQAAQPDFLVIEGVAVRPLRQGGEEVVHPEIDRLEQVLNDASPSAVRGQQGHERLNAHDEGDDKERPHPVAQPLHFGAVAVRLAVLVLAFARHVEVCYSVLEYAQRADDGAIDPSENEGQEDETDDDGHIQGHHGRQELDLRHPAQPSVQRSREVEKQQRDAQPEDDGQRDAYFPKHLTFCC